MEEHVKTIFEFDSQGNLVFKAESLDLPVVYQPSQSARQSYSFNFSLLKSNLGSLTFFLFEALKNLTLIVIKLISSLAITVLSILTRLKIPTVKAPTVNIGQAVSHYFGRGGILRLLGNSLILVGVIGLIVSFYPIAASQIGYMVKERLTKKDTPTVLGADSGFGSIISVTQKPQIVLPNLSKEPINKDFGIMIDKIDLNAPVVENVNSADYNTYMEALRTGAAHAAGTALPGQKTADGNGNTFIFAHSTLNLWEVPKYNAIFILLNKLEAGDRINTFYEGKRYDYVVETKKVVEANDVKYITEPTQDQILTLQTCDPPGTNLRRLIIQAKLINETGQDI